MQHTSQISIIEDCDSAWAQGRGQSGAEGESLDPYIGICVGLSIGFLAWGFIIALWYALTV